MKPRIRILIRDAKYLDRQMAATRAGLLWGAYHYANASDPVRQADHFLSAVSSAWAQVDSAARGPGVLLVLDFEKNGHYPGGTMRVDQAVAFVERIRQRTGVYPGIYSGEYHLRQALNSSKVTNSQRSVLANCWLWMANYSNEPRPTAPWSYWSLWQYCGDGKGASAALRLPDQCCQYQEGGAQHFSRQSIGPEGVLAKTRLGAFGRKSSPNLSGLSRPTITVAASLCRALLGLSSTQQRRGYTVSAWPRPATDSATQSFLLFGCPRCVVR